MVDFAHVAVRIASCISVLGCLHSIKVRKQKGALGLGRDRQRPNRALSP